MAAVTTTTGSKPLVQIDYTKIIALQDVTKQVFSPLEQFGEKLFKVSVKFLGKLAEVRENAELNSLLLQGEVTTKKNFQQKLITHVAAYEKAKKATLLFTKALNELNQGITYGVNKHSLDKEVPSITTDEGRYRQAAQKGLAGVKNLFKTLTILQSHLTERISNLYWHLQVANELVHDRGAPSKYSLSAFARQIADVPSASELSKEFDIQISTKNGSRKDAKESKGTDVSGTDSSISADEALEEITLEADQTGLLNPPEASSGKSSPTNTPTEASPPQNGSKGGLSASVIATGSNSAPEQQRPSKKTSKE